MTERAPRADARRNRELLLQAAAELLPEQPEATLADIADHAGIGRATVYRHFATIEALHEAFLEEAIETGLALLKAQVVPLLEGQEPGVATTEMVRRLMGPALEATSRYGTVVSARRSPDELLADRFIDLGTAILARAQSAGELITDVEPRALAITLARLIARTVLAHERGELSARDAQGVIDVFLRGMTAQQEQ